MASTQVARAAAQLHEAALDVARVAAFRGTQPEESSTCSQIPLQLGLVEGEDGAVPAGAGTTGAEKNPDVGHPGDVAIAPDQGKGVGHG